MVPTIEPTVEPTAEPTVEPTPVVIDPCQIELPTTFFLPHTVNGSWIDDCVYPVDLTNVEDGDRYYRYVTIDVIVAGSSLTATLESSEDTVMLLWEWNEADEEWDFVEINDDLEAGNTNSRITWTPVQGATYLLDLTTYESETLGDFTLKIEDGSASSQGQRMQSSNMSNRSLERSQ